MKVRIMKGIVLCFACSVFSCITLVEPLSETKTTKGTIAFPKPSTVGWIYQKMENFFPKDKAEAIVLNMQPYLYQYRGENLLAKAVEVKLEHEAVKISWEWEEDVKESVSQTSTATVEKDVTGDIVKAIFSRNKADMTSALISALTPSPSTTTTTTMVVSKKVTKRNNTIFMLEDMSNVFVFSNFLNIKLKSGEEINVVINNEYYRNKWSDALLSLLRHKGLKRDFFLGAIVRKSEIPKHIVKHIGVQGAMVLGVIKNTPAEDIGLEYKDIITKIDNVNVYSGMDLEFYLKKTRRIKDKDKINLDVVRISEVDGKISTTTMKKNIIASLM